MTWTSVMTGRGRAWAPTRSAATYQGRSNASVTGGTSGLNWTGRIVAWTWTSAIWEGTTATEPPRFASTFREDSDASWFFLWYVFCNFWKLWFVVLWQVLCNFRKFWRRCEIKSFELIFSVIVFKYLSLQNLVWAVKKGLAVKL